MSWIISLPGPVRLAAAFLLILLLPAGFLGLCALAVRQAASAARSAPLMSALAAGVTLCLLVVLALRHSPEALAWSLAAAAALSAVPFALDRVARRGAAPHAPSPLPLAVRLATALFVPLFFLWVGFVEETMQVTLPHIYFFPTR